MIAAAGKPAPERAFRGASRWRSLLLVCLAFAGSKSAAAQQRGPSGGSATPAAAATSADPILQAMSDELARSKTRLKMDNLPAPYYIEYRISDVDQFDAEATFGALRLEQRTHARGLRVVVRVGDYKQDSFYGPGQGVADIAPLDNDLVALRRTLWLATDRAYKAASQALSSKKAALSQFAADQPFDDFAHTQPLQSVGPLAKLAFESKTWTDLLVKSSAQFKTDPKIEQLSAQLRFRAMNRYFVNSEGTITRQGYEIDALNLFGSTQAADGMRLDRSPSFVASKLADLPTPEKFQTETAAMLGTLKALREAPMMEEDYRGPLLFAPDAAGDVVLGLIGDSARGVRPMPGESARTVGSFASSYKTRVLPAFLSVVDDPTLGDFHGQSLVGSYAIDDEGVRAAKVPVIENGQLVNYLIGRLPIRDFPESNGHGRAGQGNPGPTIGTLILQPSQTLSPDELKKKLIDLARDANKPYGYYVETLSEGAPRLLYRVYVQDGHEELVRGATFNDLDTRALRNDLVAAGNDPLVSNRESAAPMTVISPSLLFDELELRRTGDRNAKSPEYGPPDLTSSH